MLGVAAVVLAIDLFARDAGGSLFGELDGWQGSDAEGISSLAPVWALLVMGTADHRCLTLVPAILRARAQEPRDRIHPDALTRTDLQRVSTILPS